MPRERKGLNPRKSQKFDARTFFIIATEGNVTERKYFNSIKSKVKPKIEIEVLNRESTASSPEDVMNEMDEYVKEYILVEGDELWLIVDRDSQSWTVKQLKGIAKACWQKNYFFGLSNPCFEIWLLLHVKDISDYSEEAQKQLFQNKKVTKNRTFVEKELMDILSSYPTISLNTKKASSSN